MKRFKGLLSILVCIIILISLITACGGNDVKQSPASTQSDTQSIAADTSQSTSGETQASWQTDTSPITIDMFVDASWYTGEWKDEAAKRVTDKTGVTLNIMKPVSDDGQKLSLMISDKSLPDMVCADRTRPQWQLAISSGQLYPLEDLIDKYAPDMRNSLQPELLKNYRADDGKTYYIVNFAMTELGRQMAVKYNHLVEANQPAVLCRQDYYEEIGSPDVSTMESFAAALEKMHEKHPDKIPLYIGNSSSSVLKGQGLGPLILFFMNGESYVEDNGALQLGIRSSKCWDMLAYLNRLAQKGLVTRDSFVDSNEVQLQKINHGDVIAYSWTLAESGKSPADNPNTKYMVLKPFDSYTDVRMSTGWMGTAVTTNAKDPARCIRFLEFLSSEEGYEYVHYGVKGDKYGDVANGPHYRVVDGKPLYFKEFWDAKLKDWGTTSKITGLDLYWFASEYPYAMWETWFSDDKNFIDFNQWFSPHVEYKLEYDFQYVANSDESVIKQKILDITDDYKVRIIFAKDEAAAEALYKEFIEKCDKADMAKLEQYITKQWTNYKSKQAK